MAAIAEGAGPQEALAWEAAQRPRAAAAALAAAALLLASFLYSVLSFDDSPDVLLTDGFRDALGQPLAGGQRGLLTESARWFDDHAVELLATTALATVGTVLVAFVLGYLFRALKARRPETSRLVLYAALIGPVLYGIGPLISTASVVHGAHGYIGDGRFSTLAAHDALRTGSGVAVAQVFVGVGQLATAVATVFIALYAMKVGLLTRFMGILGGIVGVLPILPALFGPSALIQSFWLLFLGLLFLGRLRTTPPAWVTGTAVAWPSQQELRERRPARRAEGAGPAPSPPDDERKPAARSGSVAVREDDAERTPPHPVSKKRKRKRR